MLGAVVGDIIGSCYESRNTKDYNFSILSSRSKFTDDSVMTLAVAKWLTVDDSHDENELIECMCDLGRKYPHRGYGGAFRRWLVQDDPVPYNSWGNGSAMRVSPAGLYARTLDEALELAKISAEVTHNHPEGIKGAQTVAAAIFLVRQGTERDRLRAYLQETFGYDLSKTIDEIRPDYHTDVSCMGSVPQALTAYLDSNSFEDAVRKAVSIGGDSDTIAAIAGSIAQAEYGIPEQLAGLCNGMLTKELREVMRAFEEKIAERLGSDETICKDFKAFSADPFYLNRFVTAQEQFGAYSQALEEMKNGMKTSHWIWFVFPQLRGLGHSYNSWYYGLCGSDEAKAYLSHPVLGKRLREITEVVSALSGDIDSIMGAGIDAKKLKSSMTLFDAVSPDDVFGEVLSKFFGGRRSNRTLKMLGL